MVSDKTGPDQIEALRNGLEFFGHAKAGAINIGFPFPWRLLKLEFNNCVQVLDWDGIAKLFSSGRGNALLDFGLSPEDLHDKCSALVEQQFGSLLAR
eukprot:15435554-Alexandrium_andersonii.AAC.1